MAQWRETGKLFVLQWFDVARMEEADEEEEWVPQEEMVKIWIFSTREEAFAFAAHEIFERTALNQDNLPPAVVRQINEAIQQERHLDAIGMWMEATERYFDEPEAVVVKDWPLIAWVQ